MVIKNEMFLIANSFQCFLLEVLSTKVLLFPREETSVTVSIKSWKGATIRVYENATEMILDDNHDLIPSVMFDVDGQS